jgi:exodeoxyribonuclease V alpha subunit
MTPRDVGRAGHLARAPGIVDAAAMVAASKPRASANEGGPPDEIGGTVERVVYHDPRSRYLVARLHVPGRAELVTIVGRSGGVETGAMVTLAGVWDEHPTHGKQFAFSTMQVEVPTTPGGITRRLMRYPGIKEVMATRIVQRFGLDTLKILETQPRRLLEVEGLGPKTLERIQAFHATTHGPVAKLEAQLLELDLPAYLADAIHERYGDEALTMVRERPYKLMKDVRGIGFATADRIARALGLPEESDERLEAGLVHVLSQAESDGHCAMPVAALVERAAQTLGVDPDRVRDAGERMLRSGDLVLEEAEDGTPLCFDRRLHAAELEVAEGLARIATAPHEPWPVGALASHLSEGQRQAVHAVAEHGLIVLTGGPGTGKSTVVHEILRIAEAAGVERILAAPTGRAAKRLEQATGEAARTIHRLLEVQAENGRFARGPDNPLSPGLVVIDESSMLDIQLARALVAALTPEHRLLLVGDADQLPSVGPGNVLRDVMTAAGSGDASIGIVRLTEIFRQSEGSSIVENAHRILAGERPQADLRGGDGEFFVVQARDADHAHDLVLRMATERIPAAYGLDGLSDVQVLCPMHKGRAGTEAFNQALQAFHTAGAPEVEYGGGGRGALRRFRVGDRVMQTRNDYDKGVYNGDVGIVRAVDPEESECVVEIDGARVKYAGKELMALQLAYAVTIHKSQGSEFPAVIVPLLGEHHVMLRRNLLYTAVTRARSLCVIVGDPRAIDRAVRKSDAARRHTGLAGRLRAALAEPWVDPSSSEIDTGPPLGDPGETPWRGAADRGGD